MPWSDCAVPAELTPGAIVHAIPPSANALTAIHFSRISVVTLRLEPRYSAAVREQGSAADLARTAPTAAWQRLVVWICRRALRKREADERRVANWPIGRQAAGRAESATAVRSASSCVQIMLVVHDPQDVAERIDHRGGGEALAAHSDGLVPAGAKRYQALDGARQVVHVPVHERAPGPVRRARWREPLVGNTELGLVVAKAELGMGQALVRAGSLEIGRRAEKAGVPVPRGSHVVGPEVQGGEAP